MIQSISSKNIGAGSVARLGRQINPYSSPTSTKAKSINGRVNESEVAGLDPRFMAAETVSEIESEGRQWFTVASSWVAAVGFDTSSCEVMVRLLNGKEYTTQVGLGEAEGIAMSIASAGSVGQAVNHFWGP